MALSECVYKVVDFMPEGAALALDRLRQTLPQELVTLQNVQWSLPHVGHRYVKKKAPCDIG